MGKQNGKILICDRCGYEEFLACTGENSADGGYTKWNTFEKPKKKWIFGENFAGSYVDLCPECAEQYKILKEAFIKQKRE